MASISDINMDGVKPYGAYEELPEGEYVVRILGTEKTAAKPKLDENGQEIPSHNSYLAVNFQIWGGPEDNREDVDRINLWNDNATTVNIARQQLKALQNATHAWGNDTEEMHGRFALLRVKMNKNGRLNKYWEELPEHMIPQNAEPVQASAPAQTHQVTHTQNAPHTQSYHTAAPQRSAPAATTSAPPAANPKAKPDWARR